MFGFFWLKIFFTFTNSEDPDEMQHYAAFHLGLHCLQKFLFRGFPTQGNTQFLVLRVARSSFDSHIKMALSTYYIS